MQVPTPLSKLITLARTARAHIEWLAKSEYKEVGYADWEAATVEGYCGIAAAYLERLANQNGLHPIYCIGTFKSYCRLIGTYQALSGHAWIKYHDHIIDITASQFANTESRIERDFNKRVYVCKSTNPHFSEFAVGPNAKQMVSSWYVETLDELCDKTEAVWKQKCFNNVLSTNRSLMRLASENRSNHLPGATGYPLASTFNQKT